MILQKDFQRSGLDKKGEERFLIIKKKKKAMGCMSLMQRYKWLLRISFFIVSEALIFIMEEILNINPYFKIQLF